jgi:hypothetical protein
MTDRPFLFSAPMVQAILCGDKTKTRRRCKARNRNSLFAFDHNGEPEWSDSYILDPGNTDWRMRDAPCRPGDRIWVKETYRLDVVYDAGKPTAAPPEAAVFYEAGGQVGDGVPGKLRPSIHMPRFASRITLDVVSVECERLQDMNEAEARREGVVFETADPPFFYVPGIHPHSITAVGVEETEKPFGHAVRSFSKLWDHINGAGAFARDPLVWVILFRRCA